MRIAILISLTIGVGSLAPAQAAFEVLGQGARSSATSHAIVVHASEASALWYNPAGLARGARPQVAVDYARLYPGLDVGPDIGQWGIGYVRPLGGGSVGVGVAGLGADFYTESGAVVGYGRAVGTRLHLGLGVRLLRWSADGAVDPETGVTDADRSGSGLGVDVGLRCDLFRWQEGQVALGLSGSNLNEPDVSEGGGPGIPRRIVVGLGYEDAIYAAEIDLELIDGDRRVRMGGEYKLGDRWDMRLRAGASGIAGQGAAGALDAGLGLCLAGVQFDYAYHYASEIASGGHQRISLGYRF